VKSEAKNMKYETIVFDLDGTLLNTLEDLTDAVNTALASENLPERSVEEIRGFVGNGIVKLMERAVPGGRQHPAFDSMMKEFRAFYSEHCQDKTAPYDGILELLKNLHEKGMKMAVVSNKADFAVKELIPVYFADYISVCHGENEDEGIRKKPAPDMVFHALEEMNCPVEKAVYVGDSDVDLQTAKNAGMDCVGVSWGFRGRKFLEENGAKYVIDIPSELLEVIR
jgi:phosphoglycolate phosphatase